MVIINAKIVTCDNGGVIEKGYVTVLDGIIVGVREGDYRGGDEVFDADGGYLTPGFIDAHCHLGLWEEGLADEGADGNEEVDPCTPHLRALDGINAMDQAFGEALTYGITTVVTGPGSANPIAGQIVAMRTHGAIVDRMVLRAPCAMKFALGENPKSVYAPKAQTPFTRMAVASIIREQLYKAKRYMEDVQKAKEDPEEELELPEYDIKCEALLPVLRREVKAHFHAHRADDICTALRLIREFGLDGVIIHCTEGYLVADAIKEAGAPVVCGPIICTRGKPELRGLTRENVSLLLAAGVPVSVNTDAPELPIDMLLTSVAMAAQAGKPPLSLEKALSLVTLEAARTAGIESRVGSVTVGKDADLLIFRENPVGLLVKPTKVMVKGKFVF